jgi:hypothetical protein
MREMKMTIVFEHLTAYLARSGKFPIKPAVVDGEIIPDYFICENGNIWSCKRGYYLRKLATSVAGTSPYPKIGIVINGKRRTIQAHRIVCETYHQFPIPRGVTKSEWERTPNSVKVLIRNGYQVNHINCKEEKYHRNHHPSNLEWVSVKENSEKYNQQRVLNRR